MRLQRPRFGEPRRLILSFVLILLLPALAVVWLGVQLIRQDKALEGRQLRQLSESTADRVIAGIEQTISATERRLSGPGAGAGIRIGDDAVLVTVRDSGIEPYPPQHLLYFPDPAIMPAPAASAYEAGEALEYGAHDFTAAANAFRVLAASSRAPIRAGALLRLARNLRKLDRHDDALRVYVDLERLHDTDVLGLPADLVSRRARCALLADLSRGDELRICATALLNDLRAARWRIDRGTFDEYVRQGERWLGASFAIPVERRALAEATAWVWQQRADGVLPLSGRRALRLDDVDVTILWQTAGERVVVLLAGRQFAEREWFSALPPEPAAHSVAVALTDDGGRPLVGRVPLQSASVVRRKPSETGLPWVVVAGEGESTASRAEFASRRRLLLAGLSLLFVLVVAGGYSITRAMSRELAVARLQTDFVSAVSHEFRTPLTSLQQFTALLNDAEEPPLAKRRAFYQAQERAVERLRRLVESLLDFGRMEAGAHPYRLEPLDPCALVSSVVEDFAREVHTEGFTVECTVPAGGSTVNADRDALARALWNLLDNAVKYSGTSRRIFVEVATKATGVAIAVRDEGIGIPRHEQTEIFDKFVRGAASRAHGIKGTGIGLAMVRHIVQGHGGSAHVQSAPGEGSTFTILLPRVEGQ